jgi:phosphonate transport system ATP-binding protein
MLTTSELTKNFGPVTAVNKVSLEFRPGEMVGIIGRSGAGKSTLLRLMNRLTDPTSGQVNYNDENVTALRGRDRRGWQARCAMIFQQFNLVPRVDVVTNVLFGTLYRQSALVSMLSLFSREDIARAVEILRRLDIAEHAPKRAEALSGGQQQRVAIARALMQDPQVILADEPIASLDPLNAQIVMQTLRRIHEEDNRMIICNLHTLDTARTYCDRVIGMRHGDIVFDGKSSELTAKVARDIYGAGEEFSEETTSTSIDSLASSKAKPTLVSA